MAFARRSGATLSQHVALSGGNASATSNALGGAVSANDLIVAACRVIGSSATINASTQLTVTDSLGNSYVLVGWSNGGAASTDATTAMYACLGVTVTGTPTFTFTLSSGTFSAAVDTNIQTYNPSSTSAILTDSTVINSGYTTPTSTSVSIAASGSGTPAHANELIVYTVGSQGAANAQGVSSQTNSSYSLALGAASNHIPPVEDWVQTTASAVADTVTMAASDTWRWVLGGFYISTPPVTPSLILSQAMNRAATYFDLGAHLPKLRRERARLQALGLSTA